MSFLGDIVNRAYEEMAKASGNLEKSMRDKIKSDASAENPNKQKSEQVVAEEIPVEEVVEEVVSSDSANDKQVDDVEVRPTVIPQNWKFGPDVSEKEQDAIRMISQMPETTMDEMAAKAVEWYHFKNPSAQTLSDTVSISPAVVKVALTDVHKYDVDGGFAWAQNEQAHGLPELQNLNDQTKPYTVDMKRYGLSNEQRMSFADVSQSKDSTPSEDHDEQSWGKVEVLQKDVNPGNQADAWEDGYHDAFGGTRTLNENGYVEYDGTLGKFTYDPSEFQLQVVHVDADEFGNPETSYPILKYIGKEVDGRYINIPEGLTDGAFMFEGNKELQTMPKLPSSLENSFGMFMDCESLDTAVTLKMPDKLKSSQFMFANCHNLQAGPAIINVKDATGMFANCNSLVKTPKIAPGLTYADSMFAGCESLTKKPQWPASVKYADYATKGCTCIDDAERAREAKQADKMTHKFEKQQNKKSLGAHLGSVFSACMQVHAMRKSGYNVLHAIFMTKAMRKSGQFTRDMVGGWSALCRANRSGFNQYMLVTTRQFSQKRAERDAARKVDQKDAFDATHSEFKQSTKADRVMYGNGKRAMAGHFFEKVNSEGYAASSLNNSAAKMDADELETVMELRAKAGTLNASAKTYYSKQAIEMVSNQLAYYKGGMSVLGDKQASAGLNKDACQAGLDKVCVANMDMIVHKLRELQGIHSFMNDRQFDTVCKLMESSPYGKTKQYEAFKQEMVSSMKERERQHEASQEHMMKSHRRPDVEFGKSRGEQAESRFDWINKGKDNSAEMSM